VKLVHIFGISRGRYRTMCCHSMLFCCVLNWQSREVRQSRKSTGRQALHPVRHLVTRCRVPGQVHSRRRGRTKWIHSNGMVRALPSQPLTSLQHPHQRRLLLLGRLVCHFNSASLDSPTKWVLGQYSVYSQGRFLALLVNRFLS